MTASRGLDRFRKARQALSQSFYSSEAKEAAAADHRPLWLHDAQLDQDNQFGPRWLLSISEGETADGQIAFLGFACNAWRDKFFESIQADLKDGAIGPLMLSKIKTQSGNTAYDLVEWDGEPF